MQQLDLGCNKELIQNEPSELSTEGQGPILAQVQVLQSGKDIGTRKKSDHQMDCTQVALDSSSNLYLYFSRAFSTRLT